MSRKFASLILATAALACAASLAPAAEAQDRRRSNDNEQSEQQRPRVSPDEARRSAGQYGRPIDTQPRRDGNYSVLVENGGRVREVVVDGQTGRGRQDSNNDNSNNRNNRNDNDQRPRRPN